MPEQRFHERRRHQRVLVQMHVSLVQYDARGQICFQTDGQVLNMSVGGLFAMIPNPVVPKLPVWLRLRLDETPIHLKAEQIRATSLGDGLHCVSVEFDRSCIEAILKIERYISRSQASGDPPAGVPLRPAGG